MEYFAWMRRRSARLSVVARTLRQFDLDRIPLIAAGATFFILLALFPAFSAVVTIFGAFADRATISHEIYRASAFLPRGAVVTLNAELNRLIAQPPQRAGVTFVVSTLLALWSASGGLKAVLNGLDVAYEVKETRSFLKFSMSALLLTALGVVVVAVTLNIAVVLPLLFAGFPYRSALRQLISILSWPGAFLFGMSALSVAYHYGPNRRRRWRWFSWGATLATVLWLAGTALFKLYVAHFGSFDRIYGGLGALVGFMIWIWLSLVILLLGAELNRQLERQDN